jgi:hypothetical protein
MELSKGIAEQTPSDVRKVERSSIAPPVVDEALRAAGQSAGERDCVSVHLKHDDARAVSIKK